MADLFSVDEPPRKAPPGQPLADRLRPKSLAEVVGQDHLTGADGALTRLIASGSLGSMIFWGPPGTGKTTVARLLAGETSLAFEQISAVFSGVADLKKVFAEARQAAKAGHTRDLPRQLVAAAKGVLTALRSHTGQRREFPQLFAAPENQHLAVVRLRSPRATQRWYDRVL